MTRLQEGITHQLFEDDAKVLWVILSPRGMQAGRFAFYREGLKLTGKKLFLMTPAEDFYQGMFEETLTLIETITLRSDIKKIIYIGFSAGAYAALLLGVRSQKTHRILAFAPQFRLDHPLTIAYRTVVAQFPHPRFRPEYKDINQDLLNSPLHLDIFLGVYDHVDGVMVREALNFKSPQTKVHYVRCNHDVGGFLSRKGHLDGIISSAANGEVVALDDSIVASSQEIERAIWMYEAVKTVEEGSSPVDVPTNDDECDTAEYWNVKARIRHYSGDVYGAIADAIRAIKLEPKFDGHYVCFGNYLVELGIFELAAQAYRMARQANPNSYTGFLAGARAAVALNQNSEAADLIKSAIELGAPKAKTHQIEKSLFQ